MAKKAETGRPTKYKPEYCLQLIEHMSSGLSFESFAAVIDVNQDTLHEWVKSQPEFSEAKKTAKDKCLIFWEKQGIEGLYASTEFDESGKPLKSKSINASVYIFNMKNRFKWRDKQPDETDVVVNNVTALSDLELDIKLKKLLGEK